MRNRDVRYQVKICVSRVSHPSGPAVRGCGRAVCSERWCSDVCLHSCMCEGDNCFISMAQSGRGAHGLQVLLDRLPGSSAVFQQCGLV